MVSTLDELTILRNSTKLTFTVYDEKSRELKVGERYQLEIKEPGRSLGQNAYMWKLIGEIAKKEDGHRGNDLEVYKRIIEMAGIKTEYLQAPVEALDRLKKAFRVVELVEHRINEKGNDIGLFKCYYGTSVYTKDEMILFLEALKDYCTELEIPVDMELLQNDNNK